MLVSCHLDAVSLLASCCCHISAHCPTSGLCMQKVSRPASGSCIRQTVLSMSSKLCSVQKNIPESKSTLGTERLVWEIQPLLWCRQLSRGLEGMTAPLHRGPAQLPPAVEWTGTGSRLRTRLLCTRSCHPARPLPHHTITASLRSTCMCICRPILALCYVVRKAR